MHPEPTLELFFFFQVFFRLKLQKNTPANQRVTLTIISTAHNVRSGLPRMHASLYVVFGHSLIYSTSKPETLRCRSGTGAFMEFHAQGIPWSRLFVSASPLSLSTSDQSRSDLALGTFYHDAFYRTR